MNEVNKKDYNSLNNFMKHFFEYLFFKILIFSVRIMPMSWVFYIGKIFGRFIYFIGIRQKVTLKNLEIAFGKDLNQIERNSLCKQIYYNLGVTFFELLKLSSVPPKKLSNLVEIEGVEILNEALKEEKGVLLAGGHFGHWELLSAAISTFTVPMHGYAGKQKNSYVDHWINSLRKKFGMFPISKSKSSTYQMLKVLKNKQLLGIIGDLNVPNDTLFVDFFGQSTAVGQGLARYAARTKAPLLFAWIVRQSKLKHKVHIIRLNYQLTDDLEQNVASIAQMIMTQLEKVIRQHPDHYFWIHRRWKTQPASSQLKNIYYNL